MRAFQSTYVGRNDFPKSLPDFLLRQWFTLNARDRRAIRKTFRSRQWIGAALQLGFLAMTGTTLLVGICACCGSAPSRSSIQAAGSRHSDTANAVSAATGAVSSAHNHRVINHMENNGWRQAAGFLK
jgi:hypothetical protein